MSELIVIAHARAKEGSEDAIKTALRECSVPTLQEPGCIAYELYRGGADGRSFYTRERWRSKSDFDLHMGSAHVARLFGTIGGEVDGAPEIDIVESF